MWIIQKKKKMAGDDYYVDYDFDFDYGYDDGDDDERGAPHTQFLPMRALLLVGL